MKYIAFLTALVLFVPIGTLAAAYSRQVRVYVFGALVFATAFTDWFDINFLERWWYAGTTRGIEFSFVDLLAFTLLLSSLASLQRERGRLFWPAGLGPMLAYLVVGCVSVLISDPRLFGFFELTKLCRGIVIFLAVAWFVRTERDATVLVTALGGVLLCNGLFAVWQRYSGAMYRVSGTFPHENILGDYCVLVGPIVSRAYRQLQDEEVLETVRGLGMQVRAGAEKRCRTDRRKLIAKRLEAVLGEARNSGLLQDEVRKLVEKELSSFPTQQETNV